MNGQQKLELKASDCSLGLLFHRGEMLLYGQGECLGNCWFVLDQKQLLLIFICNE